MVDYSTDTSEFGDIAKSAMQVVPRLNHSQFKQCLFAKLAEEAPKARAKFDAAWPGFNLGPPFSDLGIIYQRAILFARDSSAMASSAYALARSMREAILLEGSAARLAPDVPWRWNWEKYDPIAEKFEFFASLIEHKIACFPVGKSPYETTQVLRIEQVAMEVDRTDPALGQTIRNALAVGDWDVLIAALKQCQ